MEISSSEKLIVRAFTELIIEMSVGYEVKNTFNILEMTTAFDGIEETSELVNANQWCDLY